MLKPKRKPVERPKNLAKKNNNCDKDNTTDITTFYFFSPKIFGNDY